MASEIAPLEVRGIFLVLLQFIYILGILYLIVQCYIFLDSLDSGNWRLLLRVNIAAPLMCLLCSIFILIDSPRIYICQGNFEEGFKLMDQMGKMNNPNYEAITEDEVCFNLKIFIRKQQ